MKRNKFFMLGIVTVLVAVLSLTFVSNTFARYTSTVTGSDTAKVAKWEWAFTGDLVATDHTTESVTFDIFDTTVLDLKNDGSVDTAAETDVKEGQSLIAPGTGGMAQFVIKNTSEVNALYSVTFGGDEEGVNLEWSKDNSNWVQEITAFNVSNQAIDMEDGTATITLYWRWAYNTSDSQNTTDTSLGQTPVSPSVTVSITMTQVN